jgi:arabinogalactan oligomer/maltooligosaccharide transport system permease protein
MRKPRKIKKRMTKEDRTALSVSRIIIWIVMLLIIYPAFWIFSASFSTGDSFFMSSLFPTQISFNNYRQLFSKTDFALWVTNSLKLCLYVSVIQLFLTSMAAYAFSRLRFPGKKNGLKALLLLQVFPSSMAISGYYILIYHFNLVDNLFAIILVLSGCSAFNIWLLKSYMDGIPKELDEAAFVDGANYRQVFLKIVLPLSMPQLIVIFLFTFIATYSEYVLTSVFLQSPQKFTLALGLQSFITNQFAAHWTLFAAASVLASLPIMILFMALQKFIQNGLTAGGVKE